MILTHPSGSTQLWCLVDLEEPRRIWCLLYGPKAGELCSKSAPPSSLMDDILAHNNSDLVIKRAAFEGVEGLAEAFVPAGSH